MLSSQKQFCPPFDGIIEEQNCDHVWHLVGNWIMFYLLLLLVIWCEKNRMKQLSHALHLAGSHVGGTSMCYYCLYCADSGSERLHQHKMASPICRMVGFICLVGTSGNALSIFHTVYALNHVTKLSVTTYIIWALTVIDDTCKAAIIFFIRRKKSIKSHLSTLSSPVRMKSCNSRVNISEGGAKDWRALAIVTLSKSHSFECHSLCSFALFSTQTIQQGSWSTFYS